MILSGTRADALARGLIRVDDGPFHGSGAYLIVTPPAGGRTPSPQAFRVEQDADWTFQPHFHLTAQFQIAVAGSGRLGSHALAPVTLHYAAPQAGYGPLVAGPQGLAYLTIRLQTDRGMWCLPQEKARLEHPMRRFHGWSAPINVATAARLHTAAPRIDEVMAVQPDGSSALVLTLPPGGVHERPVDRRGDEFYVVLAGELAFDGRTLAADDVAYASHDHDGLCLCAGAGGVQVLLLSFGPAALVDLPSTPAAPPPYAPAAR